MLGTKVSNFIKKESLSQVFSCEFCEVTKNTFFYRTPPVATSGDLPINPIQAGRLFGAVKDQEVKKFVSLCKICCAGAIGMKFGEKIPWYVKVYAKLARQVPQVLILKSESWNLLNLTNIN